MQSSSSWRSVDASRGVNELAGKYVWLGEEQEKCIEVRKVILTNKDWKSGGYFLE